MVTPPGYIAPATEPLTTVSPVVVGQITPTNNVSLTNLATGLTEEKSRYEIMKLDMLYRTGVRFYLFDDAPPQETP
jgi:hypothetical protein